MDKQGAMKTAHLIGICGIGMSATALLLKQDGFVVSGSDADCYGPPKGILDRANIKPTLTYAPANIPEPVDLVVIGRNAKLLPSENDEVRSAYERRLNIRSFPEVLGDLTKDRSNLVVAGSYGKSTTTSIVAHILRHAGVDAGYFIGAEPIRSATLPAPSDIGTAPVFVLEGDEYPSGHDDPRAKFMHLHPHDVVLTAVVHDHVNIYPTYEDYTKPFRDLLAAVPGDGQVVVCAEEPGALKLANESGARVVTYGVDTGDYHAADIRIGARSRFTLICPDGLSVELETALLGRHNIENIIAAGTCLLSRKLVDARAFQAAVADFAGVRRKLDNIALGSAVPVYEGFGSSYEKARSAIEAIQLHFSDNRLVVVFEPHTFGWRNRANLYWYDDVFAGADLTWVAAPATQGAATHAQLAGSEILDRVRLSGIAAEPYDPTHPEAVVEALRPGDVVLILTSGDLNGSLEALSAAVAERFALG
mgnify:CR=1 FL=1